MIIKFEYDGRSWSYDDDDLTVLQGIAVEEHIQGTLMDYDEGLASGRSVCYQALGWLIFHDASPDVDIAGVDFPLTRLSRAWLDARLAAIGKAQDAVDAAQEAAEAGDGQVKPAAAPGPTGRGSGPRSGSTSAHSRKPSATSPVTSTPSASPNLTT